MLSISFLILTCLVIDRRLERLHLTSSHASVPVATCRVPVVVGVDAARIVVVVTAVSQPMDPTWRTDAGRTMLRHDSGNTRRAPSPPVTHAWRPSAPRTTRAPIAPDGTSASRTSCTCISVRGASLCCPTLCSPRHDARPRPLRHHAAPPRSPRSPWTHHAPPPRLQWQLQRRAPPWADTRPEASPHSRRRTPPPAACLRQGDDIQDAPAHDTNCWCLAYSLNHGDHRRQGRNKRERGHEVSRCTNASGRTNSPLYFRRARTLPHTHHPTVSAHTFPEAT